MKMEPKNKETNPSTPEETNSETVSNETTSETNTNDTCEYDNWSSE